MEPLYAELVARHRRGSLTFARARSFNLDEYVGLAPRHPQSYHSYMHRHLFAQVDFAPGATALPDGSAPDPHAEADAYDGRGQLWRVSEGHGVFFYDQQAPQFSAETHYDVLSGRYAVGALFNEQKNAYDFDVEYSRKQFTPSALRAAGIR